MKKLSTLVLSCFMLCSLNLMGQYTNLYLVGSATPAGWDASGYAMEQSNSNGNLFTYSGPLKAGEFKVHTEASGDFCAGNWLMPIDETQNTALTTSAPLSYRDGAGCSAADTKWVIEADGIYTITVDQTSGTESISLTVLSSYAQLYMVGDATPNGWDLNNATLLSKESEGVYSWSGELLSGEFKITSVKTFNDGWAWYMPLAQGQSLALTSCQEVVSGSGTDLKWVVDAVTAGNYDITVNLSAPSVSIVESNATGIENSGMDKGGISVDLKAGTVSVTNITSGVYTIYNISGSQEFSGSLGGNSIDISGLNSGLYIIQVTGNDGLQLVSKFLK
ncbi:SusF/SusE family outer membrane protein [Carboxylicivirga caseinilyticus]|uniref:SusF/SusE family outer membrane protein n=1 Tax=Carboxylicivirga caseinilyticus TaxID=3417572 RepID=UPI003D34F847|nr:SusF/SusE family outer membrane protein [Marinilabiliaceae bacterium A049]